MPCIVATNFDPLASQRMERLAVLFADICGSTALYDRLGDEVARRLISRSLGILAGHLPNHGGTLVKSIGDEILCVFPSAEAAFRAACEMQEALKQAPPTEHGTAVNVRIGFHFGEVISERGDVYGDTVNVAARVSAITRAGQIMTTGTAVAALPEELHGKTRHIMRAEFKGKQEFSDIYAILWEQEDLMSTRIGIPVYRKAPQLTDEMVMNYGDKCIRLNNECKKAMLGRGDNCDIVIASTLASRQHALIELRSGKFFIADQSTNGTYVRYANGQVVNISREELVLQGKGSISLGQPFDEQPSDLVDFSIISATVDSLTALS